MVLITIGSRGFTNINLHNTAVTRGVGGIPILEMGNGGTKRLSTMKIQVVDLSTWALKISGNFLP